MAIARPRPVREASKNFGFIGWVRRQSVTMRLVLLIGVSAALGAAVTWLAVATGIYSADAQTVLWLLNLDLALLLLLVILLAHRARALWPRRGNVGSKLQGRMVLMFGLVAVTPAILVAVFSLVFFNFGLDTWFDKRVRAALTNSLSVAQAYLDEHRDVIRGDALAMAADLGNEAPFMVSSDDRFLRLVDAQAALRSLTEALVFTGNGRELARSRLTFGLEISDIDPEAIDQAALGDVVILTNETEDRVRALVRINALLDTYLLVGRLVDAEVLGYVSETERVVGDYQEIAAGRAEIQFTFTLLFGAVSLLLLLAAVWAGASFADRIAAPIMRLVNAADRVRDGDLKVRVREEAEGEEIGSLTRAFNRMTSQLSAQRKELIDANHQLDDRRRFTEAVLGGVNAGVLGVNPDGFIALPNRSAAELLGVSQADLAGKRLNAVFPEAVGLVAQVAEDPSRSLSEQIDIVRRGGVTTLLLRIEAQVVRRDVRGFVLTFDDITLLLQAQHQAAWADVARRVAHEIKNPLTPIQLSAERLARKYAKFAGDERDQFERCVVTIGDQVEIIRSLINDFSDFARMPPAELSDQAVVDVVRRSVELQRVAYPKVAFEVSADNSNLRITCDPRKLAQALTNLIQNAAQAIAEKKVEAGAEPGQGDVAPAMVLIDVADRGSEVLISVADNGPGWQSSETQRYLEPYVTTRAAGTGLGLAIVKRIMDEHRGRMLLSDTPGGGATVTLAFPGGGVDSVGV